MRKSENPIFRRVSCLIRELIYRVTQKSEHHVFLVEIVNLFSDDLSTDCCADFVIHSTNHFPDKQRLPLCLPISAGELKQPFVLAL